jgi:hypothetical protein
MKTPVDPEWVAHAQGALRLPKNARLRYADGALLVVPGRSAHFRNRFKLADWAGSIPGARAGGRFSLTPAVNGFTPEPEFALIRESAHAPHRDTYNNDEVLFVAEIISTEIEQRHLRGEHHHYAEVFVPVLLVLDVLAATWTLFTTPRRGAYALTTTGNFGEPIPVEIAGEPHPIDSGEFQHL